MSRLPLQGVLWAELWIATGGADAHFCAPSNTTAKLSAKRQKAVYRVPYRKPRITFYSQARAGLHPGEYGKKIAGFPQSPVMYL
jgi:hypothetical protein